ncbi:MAG TPA: AraC family transcriptional regulator [Ktedonobacteraceae bacterium]
MSVYSTYVPRAPLADFVERLWFYESTPPLLHARERRLPSGSVELIINLREDVVSVYDRQDTNKLHSFCAGVISGPYSTFFVIDTSCLSSLIGVAFKPGGAAPFLPFPAAELQNRHVSLETLWGAPTLELRDRLLAVDTPQARFSILEQWLLTRAKRPLLWRPTLTFALAELHPIQTISEVVEQTGLSSRRFIQLFHEAVGLTPKQFARVKRFQEVLRLVEKGKQIVWAELALSCGYYDQAHLIHEFQEFCGLTPRTYLAQRGEFRHHVPLLD